MKELEDWISYNAELPISVTEPPEYSEPTISEELDITYKIKNKEL